MLELIKTDSNNQDFIQLVKQLDSYLEITDGDEHDFYNQFNSITNLKHVVVAYLNKTPVGCGAFKAIKTHTVEIKRMYTVKTARGKGIASAILEVLEDWAKNLEYTNCVLETGIRQVEAEQFYKKCNYQIIDNYGQYIGVKNSLCFEKKLN